MVKEDDSSIPSETGDITAPFEGSALNPSPSVNAAATDLPADKPITAVAFVKAILDKHRHDYAEGRASEISLEEDSYDAEKRTTLEWLEEVRELFDTELVDELHGRIVIIGLSLLDRDLRRQLHQNGFIELLENELDEQLDTILTQRGRWLRAPADSVPTQPDSPLEKREEDQLHRVPFARYLARRMYDIPREKAYSINIYGPWGSGKSTLLNFLESELEGGLERDIHEQDGDGKPDSESHPSDQNEKLASPGESWQVIRFNAWQHQHVQPPWWALIDNVFKQSKDELDTKDKLGEYVWRLQSGRRTFLFGIFFLAVLVAILLVFVPPQTGSIVENFQLISVGIAVVSGLWGISDIITNSLFVGSSRAAQSYVESVNDPMNTIEDRFNILIDRIPKPVVIFIDDLDRCDCEYVVELLEGVQTVFSEAPVVFVVAADRDWLHSCFEEIYSDQRSAVEEPGKSVGRLFLEKTFQFSTSVPTIPDEMKEEYWENLLKVTSVEQTVDTKEDVESARQKIAEAEREEEVLHEVDENKEKPISEQQAIRESAVMRLAAPDIMEHTEHVLTPLVPLLEPNPRAMKRLVNAYSVNRAHATLTFIDIDREPLALWTILCLQYPAMADYLTKNLETVEQVGREELQDVDDGVAPLFTDESVVAIVRGDPIKAELDEAAIRACAKIGR